MERQIIVYFQEYKIATYQLCHSHYTHISYVGMQYMIRLFLRARQTNRIFLWFYLRIGMPYTPQGLQFNWSEHRPVKAEAAGSSPVSPELGFNEWTNSSFLFFMEIFDEKRGGRRQHQISMGYPYFTFFISHFSVKKEQYRNFFHNFWLIRKGIHIIRGLV